MFFPGDWDGRNINVTVEWREGQRRMERKKNGGIIKNKYEEEDNRGVEM